MDKITIGFPPYLPTTVWCRGGEMPCKVNHGRFLTRTRIWSNAPGGMVLTVPVEGGATAVKSQKPHMMRISGHGDWTRIHLGAIEAAYGKEPYFQHFFPEIAEIITRYPTELEALNRSLLSAILRLSDYDDQIEGIVDLRKEFPNRLDAIESRLLTGIVPEHSVIEPLFRYGKDVILLMTRTDILSHKFYHPERSESL